MEALSPEVAAEMRARAEAVRARQNAGTFTKSWNLTGENAICKPGSTEIVRLLPRWDYAESLIMGPDGKTRIPNPAYKPQVAYYRAHEHWFEVSGKKQREFCPRLTLDQKFRCVICLAAQALFQGTKDDKKLGKDISAKEVFIFNAIVGDPRRVDPETKLADIRPISCQGTIYNDISDIMTGGEKPQFARGNIMSPSQGYDLGFNRPAGKTSGERWSVDVVTDPSTLYQREQAAAFKGWVSRLTNLEEMVTKELKTEESIFKAYYGRDVETGELDKLFGSMSLRVREVPKGPQAPTQEQPEDGPAGTAADVVDPDDDFVDLKPPSGKPAGRVARR